MSNKNFDPAQMLRKVEQEEEEFRHRHGYPPRIKELSVELQAEIKQHIMSEIAGDGLDSLKRFLRNFFDE